MRRKAAMIECFVLMFIEDALKRLQAEGYSYETWTTKELGKYVGIKYQFIYQLEKRGVIPCMPRNSRGRLVWTPKEVYDLLLRIRKYLGRKIGRYNE